MVGPGPEVRGDCVLEREKRWQRCLREIEKGNAQSLAVLYEDTVPILYGLALRILGNSADAEEIVIEVFEQVWRNAGSFDVSRGSVWRWLTLLTRSRAIDRLRAAATRREHEEAAPTQRWEISTHEPRPDEASIFREQQTLIRRALDELPEEQRRAVEMAYFSELTHVQIAAVLNVPLGTIKTRIRMGMDKLRAALAQAPAARSEYSPR